MRTIENAVINAILNKKHLSRQNTVVSFTNKKNEECVSVHLHGNHIFDYNYNTKDMHWDDCGWPTKTTSSRLNACFAAIEKLSGKKYHFSYKNKVGQVKNLETNNFVS